GGIAAGQSCAGRRVGPPALLTEDLFDYLHPNEVEDELDRGLPARGDEGCLARSEPQEQDEKSCDDEADEHDLVEREDRSLAEGDGREEVPYPRHIGTFSEDRQGVDCGGQNALQRYSQAVMLQGT